MVTKKTSHDVELLKQADKFAEAGALAFELGLDRAYGCHYGMTSTLIDDRRKFYAAFDAAIAAQRDPIKKVTERLAQEEEILKRLGSKVGIKSFKRVKNVEPAKLTPKDYDKALGKYDYPAGLNEAQKKAYRARVRAAQKKGK